MNKKTNIVWMAVAVALLAPSCQRESELLPPEEMLTAEIMAGNPETRTVYDETTADSFVWESGDQMAVFLSDDATYNKYRIIDLEPYGDGTRAQFLCSTTTGAKRKYYAVFPADARVDAEYGQAGHALQVVLKDEYDIQDKLSTTAGADGIRPSDRVPLVMVADNERVPASGEADLQFHHVGGLLRITVLEIPSGTQRFRVTMDKDVTGTFNVSFDSDGLPSITTSSSAGRNVVTFVAAASGSSIAAGMTPVILNVPVPCATYSTVTVEALNSSGTVLSSNTFTRTMDFERRHGKKLGLQEIALTVDASSQIADISRTGSAVIQPYSQNVTVTVNRKNGSTTVGPSPWKAYFHTAEVSNGTAVSTAWSTRPLKDASGNDWLSLSAYEGDGNANAVTVHLMEATPTGGLSLGAGATTERNNLRAGPGVKDLDLSTYDILDGVAGKSCETANCYVIKTYGSYLIPCIYGNAIQGTSTYTSSKTSTTAAPILKTFVNANGAAISNAVIPEDIAHGELCARVVWQDLRPGYEMITDDDLEYVSTSGTAAHCPYIRVNFRKDRILPGNIVVALYDKTNSKILWSWHLWVTSQPLSLVYVRQADETAKYAAVLNVNLGWTPPISYTASSTAARQQYVIIASVADGKVVDCFKVSQAAYSVGSAVSAVSYSNTYYQYGRKDPLLPSDGNNNNRQVSYGAGFDGTGANNKTLKLLTFTTESAAVRLGQMIQKPYQFFNGYNQEPKYLNLWNIDCNVFTDMLVRKTIYDPSPRGFKMPHRDAFNGFTSNGTSSATDGVDLYGSWVAASGEMPAGYNLTTNHSATTSTWTFFFPASGIRHPVENTTGAISQIHSCNTQGLYFSAGPHTANSSSAPMASILCMTFTTTYVNPSSTNYSNDGRCVRPIFQYSPTD